MKKNLKIAFILVLIFVLLISITYSYAISSIQPGKIEKQFFTISKTEFTKNEKVEMTINLDSIKYNEFTFELKSNEDMKNLEIEQSKEIEAQKDNNEIVMEINKAKTNVKTINLFYTIPEDKKVGDTIKFIATITGNIKNEKEEANKEEDKQSISKEETNKEENKQTISKEETNKEESKQTTEKKETTKEENKQLTEKQEINKQDNKETTEKKENEKNAEKQETNELIQEKQSIELEIKIVEEENKVENNKPTTDNNKQEINKVPSQNNSSLSTQKIPSNYSNIQYSSISIVSTGNNQAAKVTYNGSDNNYLSNLSVEGYTLNRAFSKENTTYFVTVGNEIGEVNIIANVDDDEATVTIYGNKDLKEGTNKILIAVTAENGNVRNYRIYVTKNS